MAAVLLSLLGGLRAGPAAADDVQPRQRVQAQNLARQIDSQGERISVLAEQYDRAVLAQQEADRQLAGFQRGAEGAASRARSVDGVLRSAAVTAYVRGPGPAVVLTAKADPDEMAVAHQYVSVGLSQQRDLLQRARNRHGDLERRQAQAATAAQEAADATRRVAIGRASAESAVAADEKLLAQVQDQPLDGADQRSTPDTVLSSAASAVVPMARAASAGSAQAGSARPAPAGPNDGPDVSAPTSGRPAAAAAAAQPGPVPARPTATNPAANPVRTDVAPTSHPVASRPATSAAPPRTSNPPSGTSNPPSARGAALAVSTAKAQLGKPYLWAGAGPDSFDCSGLTMFAWRAAGVSLPHSSAAQYSSLPHVSANALQPGDLLFFGSPIHHVGLYVGGGQMIEAAHTGTNVRYASISRSDFVGAARP